MTWDDDRAQRRAAREREGLRREFADLDRRYGIQPPPGEVPVELAGTYQAPQPRPRRRGCFSRLISLTLVVAMGVMALSLLGTGVAADNARALLERATEVVESLVGADDLDDGTVYTGAGPGRAGSGGQGYTFSAVQADGVSPVTWPCEGTIPIEINPDGAPDGYAELVGSAVQRINEASGFTFEVVGETSDRDFLDRRPGPVLLGFAGSDEVAALEGRTAGVGGSLYASGANGREFTAVGGMVVLDEAMFARGMRTVTSEAVVIHELAHVLGLGHTDQRGQLMRATNTFQVDFGDGDLAGLAHLRDHACS